MSANVPAELPNIADARLPAAYETAKQALAECSRIDECQNWADKAAALASYARQARDDTLLNFATRIKTRALDRCGELLRQIPASPGGRPETKDAADLSLSPRQQAAQDAHLSERQRKTALRINSIPRERFEALVESEKPPTATQLAEMGKKKRQRPLRNLGDGSSEESAVAGSPRSRGKNADRSPTLDPVAWAMSTAEERAAFIKAVGRREIEDVLDMIDPRCTSTSDALGESWIAATEPDRLAFAREYKDALARRLEAVSMTVQAMAAPAITPEQAAVQNAVGRFESIEQAWHGATDPERLAFARKHYDEIETLGWQQRW